MFGIIEARREEIGVSAPLTVPPFDAEDAPGESGAAIFVREEVD
jgi:hypothetical protein